MDGWVTLRKERVGCRPKLLFGLYFLGSRLLLDLSNTQRIPSFQRVNSNLPTFDLHPSWLLLFQALIYARGIIPTNVPAPRFSSVFQIVKRDPRQSVHLLEIQEHPRQRNKIAVLHTLQRRLLRHHRQRQTVLGARELVVVELRMLLHLVPDGVESRAEHVDHAREEVEARDETPAFQRRHPQGETADRFVVGYL